TFINEANDTQRQDILQREAEKINTYFYSQKDSKELFLMLEEALGDDLELYLLVLSTIYYITEEANCIDLIENLLLRPELDLFVACNVCFQLSNIRFRKVSLNNTYARRRSIQRFLLERYETECPFPVPFLPYEQRNKRRIVIETDLFINELHAPTRIVMETCRMLVQEMGYEVFLLVNVEWMSWKWMEQFWFGPYLINCRKDINGSFTLDYDGLAIQGYQISWRRETVSEMQQLMRELYAWKPLCIWHIGGDSFRHDYYRNLTTVLSMPCTNGYCVSEAPVLVSYMHNDSEQLRESMAYSKEQKQKMVDIEIVYNYKEEGKNYKKSDFNIPEDAFVISIVGTRLDDEMSEEFIHMLYELEEIADSLYYLIIGKCTQKPFLLDDETKVQYLGFRKDLLDVIKVSDLFVNPPRKGGGGGACRALSVGVPVVTLPDCDVSSLVGDAFCCQNLEEMKEEILRYQRDPDFYREKQEKVKEKNEENNAVNNLEYFKMLFQQLEKWLETGEIR
nr:glycosyltransferase [Lachnospiraceae bacterium]